MPAHQPERFRFLWSLAPLQRWAGPLATLAASLGAFAFFALQGIFLARLLGPEMRGAFAAAVLFPQTLLYLGLLGAPELFAGYAARGADNSALRRSAARYGIAAGAISLLVCWLLDISFIRNEFRWMLPLACLCALALPLQQIRLAVQAVDHGQRELGRYNRGRLLAAAAFPALLAVAFLFGVTDLKWICVLFVVSQALALLLAQLGMRQSWRGRGHVAVPKAIGEARPLIAAWLASELLERLDLVLMLALVSDEATLGYYAAAVPIASLLIIVPNAASLYAFNLGARSDEIPNLRTVGRWMFGGLLIQTLSGAILAAMLPWLIHLFYGELFAPTVMFAWLLIPAGMFRGLLQALDGYLRARGRAMAGVLTRSFATVVLVATSLALPMWLERWDIPSSHAIPIGLSLALACCFVIMSAIVLMDVRDHHRHRPALPASGGPSSHEPHEEVL